MKAFQELTIMDAFMFGAVMSDSDLCRELLEKILEMPIERIRVISEKSIIYHPEYKGIRLDIYAKDEHNTHYDVEMQVRSTPVEKRSRYYHSQMDMEMLLKGSSYTELPDSYVIFICNFDPFEKEKYRYSIESRCIECPHIDINDGAKTIILNNRGRNPEDVPEELVAFLDYTRNGLNEVREESENDFIRRIQKKIREIKANREMGERYMQLELMLQEEREEGRKEGRKEGLEQGSIHTVSDLIARGYLSIEQGAESLGISADELGAELANTNPE